MTIAVLGAGMVGSAIALDLAQQHRVTCFDINAFNLEELKKKNDNIQVAGADFQDYNSFPIFLEPFDMVVTAVPGFMGFKTLEAVINAGKNVVDISFFPEDALQLHALAQKKEVTAVVDCGIAPGMSNLVVGRYNQEMKIEKVACYVGGLPVEKKPPFFYKAPFSPVDVIQEYIRPARLVEQGQTIVKPPLTDREMISFEGVGILEAFNTDGLRTLIATMAHIPEMKEKTLRYPGHADLIVAMKEAGFFDTTPLRFGDADITPLAFTSKMLVNQWKLEPGEQEFTVMRIILQGEGKTIEYNMFDYYDQASGISSMARTTGYTCSAMVNAIGNRMFTEKGVFPPELVAKDEALFNFVLSYLAERGVHWKKSIH